MYDTVIIGSGLAALCTALAIDSNRKVLLLTKDKLRTSNTYLAQGGIAASLDQSNDSLNSHVSDTIRAGANANDLKEVTHLVNNSKEAIEFLVENGCKFDLDEDGMFKVTREGGHSMRRILHAGGDATGKHMIDDLLQTIVKQKNIEIIEDAFVSDIRPNIVNYFVEGKIKQVNNTNIVICTGGANNIYQYSTNPSVTNGNGIMFASTANLQVEDMHYIQFHPTTYHSLENNTQRFLISEAVRGEGAVLRNDQGETFMSKYHELKDLAPRDIVSRAIIAEMKKQETNYVYLDARELGKEFLTKRFPTIYNHLALDNIFMEKDLIPVSPAAHYTVGGIKTDEKGRTNVEGIFACGECASTGIHGANRLASNSLLECVVYAKEIASVINKSPIKNGQVSELGKCNEIIKQSYVKDIEATISSKLGILRKSTEIEEAKEELELIKIKLLNNRVENKQWYEEYSKVITGLKIIESYEKKPESLGCHAMGE